MLIDSNWRSFSRNFCEERQEIKKIEKNQDNFLSLLKK